MTLLLVLPLLLPAAGAGVSLLLPPRLHVRRGVALLVTAALTGVGALLVSRVWRSGPLALQVSGWPAPLGITLVADLLGALMVLLTGGMGLAVSVASAASLRPELEAHAHHPLVLVLLTGVCGSFLTGDLFNLFVWFEVMLVASFVLLSLEAQREQLEASIKYTTLSLLGSALFLTALALLYGSAGTLNMADLARRLPGAAPPTLYGAVALLFLGVFALKAGAFPLFFWLPASYPTPPVVVTTLFSALLTKVGVYALFRTFTLLFIHAQGLTHGVLLWMAGLSMVTGVLGAVAQHDVRRLLSFHIISQIGYLLAGVALATRAALAAAIVYLVHYTLAKSALFLVSGAAARVAGSYDLHRMGGLAQGHPLVAALFLVPALSLAGVPPFSGFFAKASLLWAALRAEAWALAATAAAVGLLTLHSMVKVWREAFWKPAPHPLRKEAAHAALLAPCVVLAGLMVALGLGAEPLFVLAGAAADQLMDRESYIRAVLGEER